MAEHSVWRPFRLSDSSAQARLEALAANKSGFDMRTAFAKNPDRVAQLSRSLDGLFVDMSKQKWDLQVLEGLLDLAREADIEGAIGDLFGGVKLNATEGRAVLHMALRADQGDVFTVDGEDVVGGVLDVRERMLRFVDSVHAACRQGTITDVVNIGIGGSDLGPAMAVKALRRHSKGPQCHFISNVDGAHAEAVLSTLNPQTTMLVVVSKTFTTQETMANAAIAKDWLVRGEGTQKHKWLRCPPTWKGPGHSGCLIRRPSGLRIGLEGAIPCGGLLDCALPCPSARKDSWTFWQAQGVSTGIFKKRHFRTTCPFCWRFWATGIKTFWGIGRMSSCLTPKI